MISNHPYRCCHLSQCITWCMYDVGLILYKQINKGISSILTTQNFKYGPTWIDGKLNTFCLCIGWCVIYHGFQSFTKMLIPPSIYQWVHGWDWSTTSQATKQEDNTHTDHATPKWCAMGRWIKTATILAYTCDSWPSVVKFLLNDAISILEQRHLQQRFLLLIKLKLST